GDRTTWIPAWRLSVVGDMVCLHRSESPWSRVESLRISRLDDGNVAAILAALPLGIEVRHLGSGVVEVQTRGRDLTRWVRSRVHDPEQVPIARYEVKLPGGWAPSLTWQDLVHLGAWMVGWPIAGTSAEVRRVDVARSIALSIVSVPAVLAVAG